MLESIGSDDEPFEADVLSKRIKVVYITSGDPEGTSSQSVISVSSDEVEVREWIDEVDEYSEDDFDADSRLREFP